MAPFPGLPGCASARNLFLDFMVQGKTTEADTPTIRLGATQSGLISDPPPSSPIFTLDAPPAANLPLYPSFGQASNMLACTTSGVVGNMYRKLHESFFRYAHEQTDKETHKHSDRNILHPACGQSNYIQQPLEFKCNLTASESYIIRQVTNKQSIRNAHSTYHSACKTLHIPVLRTINNVLSVTFSKCCLKSHGQR